jgi:hypothetical protein
MTNPVEYDDGEKTVISGFCRRCGGRVESDVEVDSG